MQPLHIVGCLKSFLAPKYFTFLSFTLNDHFIDLFSVLSFLTKYLYVYLSYWNKYILHKLIYLQIKYYVGTRSIPFFYITYLPWKVKRKIAAKQRRHFFFLRMLRAELIAFFMYGGSSERSSEEKWGVWGRVKEYSWYWNVLFTKEMFFRYLSGIMTLQTKMNLTSTILAKIFGTN